MMDHGKLKFVGHDGKLVEDIEAFVRFPASAATISISSLCMPLCVFMTLVVDVIALGMSRKLSGQACT